MNPEQQMLHDFQQLILRQRAFAAELKTASAMAQDDHTRRVVVQFSEAVLANVNHIEAILGRYALDTIKELGGM